MPLFRVLGFKQLLEVLQISWFRRTFSGKQRIFHVLGGGQNNIFCVCSGYLGSKIAGSFTIFLRRERTYTEKRHILGVCGERVNQPILCFFQRGGAGRKTRGKCNPKVDFKT